MPTALKRKATGERLRRFLWWASLSTSYANFLMFFVIDIEAIKAGTGAVLEQNRSGGDCFFNCFFEANRDALMLLNLTLFVPGLLLFLYLTWYNLIREERKVVAAMAGESFLCAPVYCIGAFSIQKQRGRETTSPPGARWELWFKAWHFGPRWAGMASRSSRRVLI